MNQHCSEPDETIVVEPRELEASGQLRAGARVELHDEAAGLVLGKGTRDELPLRVAPGQTQPIERPRDPAEVLRMWPASMGAAPPRPAPSPDLVGATRPSLARRNDDKVALAHLALDLYRELGQAERGADAGHAGHSARELARCTDAACEARIDALRGALVEACLLVQRVVMMTPATDAGDGGGLPPAGSAAGWQRGLIDDHVRELLKRLER